MACKLLPIYKVQGTGLRLNILNRTSFKPLPYLAPLDHICDQRQNWAQA